MKTLINLLSAYYNQDVWEEFVNDNPQKIEALKMDLQTLLLSNEKKIHEVIKMNSSELSMDTPEESAVFINDLYNYIKQRNEFDYRT